jgi:hypothetical protein
MGLDTGINYMDETEIVYWRKANAIHKWFVNNVQDGNDDCGRYEVTLEQLTELRELCKEILDDNKLAGELLPTQSGFFFGSTDYDDWYFENIRHTYNTLSDLLEYCSADEVFVYWSSW